MLGSIGSIVLVLLVLLPLVGIARASTASKFSHPWEKYLSLYIEAERNKQYPQLRLRSTMEAPGSRHDLRTIVFNHNPKAAGTYIVSLFEHALSKQPEEGFIVETERQSIGKNVGFTVGAVREPCSHLVSLWAFGSQGKGGFRKRMERYLGRRKTQSLYGLLAPFNSTEDVLRFRKWVRHRGVQGFMTAIFAHSYSNITSVDCFIIADTSIEEEAKRCLNKFFHQADELLTINSAIQEASASLDHNLGSHAPCDTYFDDQTAREVERAEWPLFEAFGWAACCLPPPSRKTPPPLIVE